MLPLLTSDQMRSLDANAIDDVGIPGIVLMENAALAVLQVMEERYEDMEDRRIAVVCGPGNNGGDGYALARQLHLRGAEVDIYATGDPARLEGDARVNFVLTSKLGIPLFRTDQSREGFSLEEYDLIVDAIFGTGTIRAPEGAAKDAIDAINESGAPVIAIDLPSGVDGSTGHTPGVATHATVTVGLEHAKLGHFFPPGRDHCGDVIISPISIPELPPDRLEFQYFSPLDEDVEEALPVRSRDAHKGDCGRLMIVAGSRGMSGAARLVAQSAYRSGVGLVKVACPESIRAEIAAGVPEATTIGLPETTNGTISEGAIELLKSWMDWPGAFAVGPGLGRDEETGVFLQALFSLFRSFRMVIDADALNLIADHELFEHIPAQSVLTPHPGEFSRLMQSDSSLSGPNSHGQFAERVKAARTLAAQWQTTLVLKGSPTVTIGEGPVIVNPTGNAGLATGGTGDVLTGIIAGLIGQGVDLFDAAWSGCFLHGRSADLATHELGETSLIATDVIRFLPLAIRSLSDEQEHE